jgi:hypothetical protein
MNGLGKEGGHLGGGGTIGGRECGAKFGRVNEGGKEPGGRSFFTFAWCSLFFGRSVERRFLHRPCILNTLPLTRVA